MVFEKVAADFIREQWIPGRINHDPPDAIPPPFHGDDDTFLGPVAFDFGGPVAVGSFPLRGIKQIPHGLLGTWSTQAGLAAGGRQVQRKVLQRQHHLIKGCR